MAGDLLKTIGSLAGGAIGTAVAPGVGTAIGSKIGGGLFGGGGGDSESTGAIGGMGLLKMIQGKRQQKKADASMPGREDPEERAALNYTKRQRRAFQTGTAMKANRDSLAAMTQSGINKSISAGGGTRGLNMMQSMFNKAMLGSNQQGQDRALQYNQQAQTQLKGITDRKLQLGMLKHSTLQARAAQTLQEGKEASNLALSKMVNVGAPNTATAGGTSDAPSDVPVN